MEYVFERFSDDWRRVINQTGVKQAFVRNNDLYNCCWDALAAPDGLLYFPLSSEGGASEQTKLACYDFETNEITECYYAGALVNPQPRQLPHSKLHTSMNVIPRSALYPNEGCTQENCGDIGEYGRDSRNNGRVDDKDHEKTTAVKTDRRSSKDYLVLGVTHSTDKAKHHPEWLPFGYHNHLWKGFPGSQILVYDPLRRESFSLGTPVPHESIYGAKYDPKHNRLYMIGFMRGHVYCYDFAKRCVIKDLGKATEVFTYRLELAADGHIYGCTKSGQLFRINTDKVALENLKFRVPAFPNNYVNNTFYRYMTCGRNSADGKYLYMTFAALQYLYRLELSTGEVEMVGSMLPLDGLYELPGRDASWHSRSFVIDKNGVFWFLMTHWCIHNETEYSDTHGTYLIRWDLHNGEDPFCCGNMGTVDRCEDCITELEYDPVSHRLLYVNAVTDRKIGEIVLTTGGIDLHAFAPVCEERGPVCRDPQLKEHRLSEAELSAREERVRKRVGEDVPAANPFQAFHPDQVTPVRVWRSVPRERVEESSVIGVAFSRMDEDAASQTAEKYEYAAGQIAEGHEGAAGRIATMYKNAIAHTAELCGDDRWQERICSECSVIGKAADDGYILHVICGTGKSIDDASYVMIITKGIIRKCIPADKISAEYREWLKEHASGERLIDTNSMQPMQPMQSMQYMNTLNFPSAAGRHYLAEVSAMCPWNNGQTFICTKDGLAAIVREDGSVYSLGNASAYGPIRGLTVNAARTKLWGIAGDEEDMGYVFTYDDREGLRQLGMLNYNIHGYFDGPSASNLLSAIALSPDEKYLAIGSADRIAVVHIIKLMP